MSNETSKHTPGPWADWMRDDGAFHVGTVDRVYVCRMIGEQDDPEVKANARLILAAPDLFEALRLARSLILSGESMSEQARGIIDGAIARVTGVNR
jgi:hypothetical protein